MLVYVVELGYFYEKTTKKDMLIEFRVSNFRSIAEEQIISLLPASNQNEFKENILGEGKFKGLNALALYGPNNTGKTNLLNGIVTLDLLINKSSSSNSTSKLPYDPNLLIEGYDEKPTSLEITFVLDDSRYRYGLEYNQDVILSEWLFRKKVGREVELFFRELDTIQVSSGFNGSARLIDTAIEATRNNGLFLASCDTLNVTEAKLIFSWFEKLICHDALGTDEIAKFNTINLIDKSEEYKAKIVEHLRNLGFVFDDLIVQKKKFDSADLPEHLDKNVKDSIIRELSGKTGMQINIIKKTYKTDGNIREEKRIWPLFERESAGTQNAFSLSGPIVYTLINGGILVIDEIEAKLHTNVTSKIIELFLDSKTNPNGAQLIFATHDTNLLKRSNLRRDQISFVEMSKIESTAIYTLSDFKYFKGNKERPDTDKEKRYLEGRYGAIPEISGYGDLFQQF